MLYNAASWDSFQILIFLSLKNHTRQNQFTTFLFQLWQCAKNLKVRSFKVPGNEIFLKMMFKPSENHLMFDIIVGESKQPHRDWRKSKEIHLLSILPSRMVYLTHEIAKVTWKVSKVSSIFSIPQPAWKNHYIIPRRICLPWRLRCQRENSLQTLQIARFSFSSENATFPKIVFLLEFVLETHWKNQFFLQREKILFFRLKIEISYSR